jgi:hypothetical protein
MSVLRHTHNDHPAQAGTDDRVSIRRCIVLTLIGIAAIVVATFLLSTEPTALSRNATTSAQSVPATQPAQAADKPFDYFPAQFPTPRGDAEELPATF